MYIIEEFVDVLCGFNILSCIYLCKPVMKRGTLTQYLCII